VNTAPGLLILKNVATVLALNSQMVPLMVHTSPSPSQFTHIPNSEDNIIVQVPYSKHFISFVFNEWVQKARVLYNIRLEILYGDKHSSLLGPFVH
jgi:hypothetical protein